MNEAIAAAFRVAPDYQERDEGVFDVDRLDFDAELRVGENTATLVQELPTLDATVVSETVAPVVAEGWQETFERRVEDVTNLVSALTADPEVWTEAERLRVRMTVADTPENLPEAVRNAANYVEATWVEGIIPGYEYEPRVQAIRDRASETANEP